MISCKNLARLTSNQSGHMTVGYVAQNFVSNDTAKWAQDILGLHTTWYLASIAPWADRYRATPAGQFTETFHYIDAVDNPPNSCNLNYSRDCTDKGCLVSAIANYVCIYIS